MEKADSDANADFKNAKKIAYNFIFVDNNKKLSPQEYITFEKSNILYVDKNKNRVNNWLNVNRLQLPLRNHNSVINNNAISSPESQEVSQKISSAKTSIKQIPALFKNSKVEFGKTNVDIGGGRFDLATQYLAERGTKNYIFDPFNRSDAENTEQKYQMAAEAMVEARDQ